MVLGIVCAAACAITASLAGVMVGLERSTSGAPEGETRSVAQIVTLHVVYWAAWGLIGLGLLRALRRLTMFASPARVVVPVHLVAAACAIAVHIALLTGFGAWALGAPWPPILVYSLANHLLIQAELATCAALLVMLHVFAFQRATGDRDQRVAGLEAALSSAELDVSRREFPSERVVRALEDITGLIRTEPERADEQIEELATELRERLRTAREGRSATRVP